MFFHKTMVAYFAVLFVLLACATEQAGLAGDVSRKVQATVVGRLEMPSAKGLWTCATRDGQPAAYRLWRAGKGTDAGGLWKLTRFRPTGDRISTKWETSHLGTLRLSLPVFCGGQIHGPTVYPGGFTTLEEDARQCILLYSVEPLTPAGMAIVMDYPYVVCERMRTDEGMPIQRYPWSPPDEAKTRRWGPMSVAWARKLENHTWLGLATSGHVLHVSGADSTKSQSTISVLGGIAGIANLKPLPLTGPRGAADSLIEFSRCLGGGQLRKGFFPALCARLPSAKGGSMELLLFKVTVKDKKVTSERIAVESLAGATALPLVLPSLAARDMELHWCSVTGKPPSRRLVMGKYTPKAGILNERLSFNIEGTLVAGYVDAKGGTNVFVVRRNKDASADLLHVNWR